MIILWKLIVAHLIGDFLLQTKHSVEHKERYKWRSWQLYFHVFLHFILMVLLIWDPAWSWPILFITATHLIMDGIKVQFQRPETEKGWFFADQLVHFTVILSTWAYMTHPEWDMHLDQRQWMLLGAILFLTTPVGMFIGVLLSRWSMQLVEVQDSLSGAGRYIGILERLLAFIFVISGHWEAVGFLLAAKSVFRFGDLSRSRDRKLTEYILVGTLMSFSSAILIGILVTW
ncbi:MAG: DUF3307 domain-containing protein [Bacteroidota bacterium]|nr:DUF3307 domain-containing protein [Bacteroidota bacterium]MDX5448990.1 DUF3307 domain-containing protein [Bacteroidota bacterium]